MNNEKLLLTAAQAAELLGVKRGFMYRNRHGRHTKTIPFLMVGGAVRYRSEDLKTYVTENLQTTPNPAPPSLKQMVEKSKGGRPTKKESLQKKGLLP